MTLKMVPKTTLPLPNWWIHWNVVVLPKALNEFVHWQVCQSSLVMSNGYDCSVSLGHRYLNTEISLNHVVSIRSNFLKQTESAKEHNTQCIKKQFNGPFPASFSFIWGLFKQAMLFFQQMWKMTIQYLVQGLEPATPWIRVSSHNH